MAELDVNERPGLIRVGYGVLLLRVTAAAASFEGGSGNPLWPLADLSQFLHWVELITSALLISGLTSAYAGAGQAAIELVRALDGGSSTLSHVVQCALALSLAMLGRTASSFDFHLLGCVKRIDLTDEGDAHEQQRTKGGPARSSLLV